MRRKSEIINETRDEERAYFRIANVCFKNIVIDGPADGESAFKECRKLNISDSIFNLRYPCWHNFSLVVEHSRINKTGRSPFWYDTHVILNDVVCLAPKAVRECRDFSIIFSQITSDEFAWKCQKLTIRDSKLCGEYQGFETKYATLERVSLKGKYAFQYNECFHMYDSEVDSKDFLWHAHDAYLENCTLKGEYIGWHAKNITFKNCLIIGKQPLCYAKNITLIDCRFQDAELAFEYSTLKGNIIGTITSIKNPLSGVLVIDEIPLMITNKNKKGHGLFFLHLSNSKS